MRLIWMVAMLAACPSPRDEPAPRAAAATARAQPASIHLTCLHVLPDALVQKYIPGYQRYETGSRGPDIACRYELREVAERRSLRVLVNCEPGVAQRTIENLKQSGSREIAGIGRAAVISTEGTTRFLNIWDEDTDCAIQIDAHGNEIAADPVPLGKDLAAALTPAALQ